MGKTMLLGTALFACLISYVACEDCSQERLDNCSNTLLILTNDNYIPVSTVEELEAQCREAEVALQCLRSYATNCLNLFSRTLIGFVAEGAEKASNRVCTKEGMEEALLHNTCIIKTWKHIRSCLKAMTNGFANVNPQLDIERRLGTGCCIFDAYRECTSNLLRRSCGEETMEYFMWATNTYTSDLFDLACVGYDQNSKKCPELLKNLAEKKEAKVSSFASVLLKVFGNLS